MPTLEPLPEDWSTALAVVAHPDDMEYGAAAAVARWTKQGKRIAHVLATDGEDGSAWDGVRFVAFSGSPQPTHAVDVTDTFDDGVASLACHRVYLESIGGDLADPDAFLRGAAEQAGASMGVELATTFEVIG